MTTLLHAVREGDHHALDHLVRIVYEELRQLSVARRQREAGVQTVRVTALVYEAYLKLAAGGAISARDRVHFLAVAARSMRRLLVEQARNHRAGGHGEDWARATFSDGRGTVSLDPVELLALDHALLDLDARQRQVVELRFFGGMEETEVADVLGVSASTVRRDWVKARSQLYRTLYIRTERDS